MQLTIAPCGAALATIALLCGYLVAVAAWLSKRIRDNAAALDELAPECERLIQQREFRQVYQVLAADKSFFARVLSTGIAQLPNGLAEAREGLDRASRGAAGELQRAVAMLAVPAIVAPLVGVLGSGAGVMAGLRSIDASGDHAAMEAVAAAIADPLVSTCAGLALAVPSACCFLFFRNRIAADVAKAGDTAAGLLARMQHAAQPKVAPAAN